MNYTKLFSVLILLLLCGLTPVFPQVTQVQFIKVKGDADEYLKLEQEWKKVHQKRLDQDMIYAWYLLKKQFPGTMDGYDYATVTVFPTIGSLRDPYPMQLFAGLDPDLEKKANEIRDIVKTEIYDTPIILEVTNLPQFIIMEFMKVEEGNDNDYLTLEDEIWKPAHAEMKKRGVLITWSVYRQLYPGGYNGEYNYVVSNGFADLKKVTFEPVEGWDEMLTKIHPGINLADTFKRTYEARKTVKNELWEMLEKVVPQ